MFLATDDESGDTGATDELREWEEATLRAAGLLDDGERAVSLRERRGRRALRRSVGTVALHSSPCTRAASSWCRIHMGALVISNAPVCARPAESATAVHAQAVHYLRCR